ncbi:methylglyoxal reductase [Phycisphaerales bacterium]|nr:methylglyoxal reductase [Phycisphaerales bacterium]
MRTRPIGQSGIQGSVVALGTWVMGGSMWGGADEASCVRAIRAAVDRGMNFIDTAPIYGFGQSELIVGKALKGRRDRAVIATKCGMVCNTRSGEFKFRTTAQMPSELGHIEVYIYNHADSIRREVEDSLQRLQTDYIDLYQTHWQESTTPIEDTMGALTRLKEQGKIRAIGVCNATGAIMDRYRKVGPLDSDQEKYSMLDRRLDAEQLPYCKQHNIAVLAYSPLALGLLTGKVGPDREFNEGDVRRNHPRFSKENRERIGAMLARFRGLTAKHNCTMSQLVIAWTIAQPGLTHALVGARDAAQVEENAKGGEISLSEAEVHEMNDAARAWVQA